MKQKRLKIDRRYKRLFKFKHSLCYYNPTWLLKHASNTIDILYSWTLVKDIYFKKVTIDTETLK